MTNLFLQKLHDFFIDQSKHQLRKKIVFAAGTAPMKKQNSEMQEIFYATEFDNAYFVDPMYLIQDIVDIDLQNLALFAENIVQNSKNSFTFHSNGKKREIHFIAGDATLLQNMPKEFSIYFSGRKIGMYPGFGLRGSPSDYLQDIINCLQKGGYVIPDRALTDDAIFFPQEPRELGLIEIQEMRTVQGKHIFDEEKFISQKKGVSLYKKC